MCWEARTCPLPSIRAYVHVDLYIDVKIYTLMSSFKKQPRHFMQKKSEFVWLRALEIKDSCRSSIVLEGHMAASCQWMVPHGLYAEGRWHMTRQETKPVERVYLFIL